jgi:two-component sensor histidine kinase
MTFLPAVLVGGLLGGIRVGLAITALSIVVGWSWFFPPYGTLVLTQSDGISMAIFVVSAALHLYVVRRLGVAIDDLRIARDRSNTLVRELQHRVANNLQSVAAFLYMRKKTLEPGSAGAAALDGAQERLDLMSRVHRHLNNPRSVEQSLTASLHTLSEDLVAASNAPQVKVSVDALPVQFDLETLMSLSLIVAELVTNSLKHGFAGGREGTIAIRLERDGAAFTLTVTDDGAGVSNTVRGGTQAGLGRRILHNIAAGLDGTISWQHGRGTVATLVFKPTWIGTTSAA